MRELDDILLIVFIALLTVWLLSKSSKAQKSFQWWETIDGANPGLSLFDKLQLWVKAIGVLG